jgi:hypothetical protein
LPRAMLETLGGEIYGYYYFPTIEAAKAWIEAR